MHISSTKARSAAGGPFRGRLLILAAAVLWGTTGTAQALAPAEAHPLAVGALRMAVGGSALLLTALARGVLRRGAPWPLQRVAVGAAALAAYQLFFFSGVVRTGVAVGTMVAIGSAPVLTGLLALSFRGERPSARWYPATLLAVAGCTFLALGGGEARVDGLGILLALGAGGSYAAYVEISTALLDRRSPDAVTALLSGAAALMVAPLLLAMDIGWAAQPRGAAVVLHLGLVATAAGYLLFSRGLVEVPSTTAVTLALAEPMTAGLLGILLLGEPLTGPVAAGLALILSGLLVLAPGTATRPPIGRLASPPLAPTLGKDPLQGLQTDPGPYRSKDAAK